MVRSFQKFVARDSILVPRWIIVLLAFLAVTWVGYRMMSGPTWLVQRLDAPDGERSARLLRMEYIRHHFRIQAREGLFWQTLFVSEPFEADYRVDLEERLRWSDDSNRLYLHIQDEPVWVYDFETGRRISRRELMGHE